MLIDATVRFLGEFVDMEKPSLIQQSQQLAEKGKARENEREKKVDNGTDPFIPTYVYDEGKEAVQTYAGTHLCPRSAVLLLICAVLLSIERPAA